MSNSWRKAMAYLGLVDELDDEYEAAARTTPRAAPDPEPTVRIAAGSAQQPGPVVDVREPATQAAPDAPAAPQPAPAPVADDGPDNVRPLRPAGRRRSRADTASHVAVMTIEEFDQVQPVGVRLRAREPVVLDLTAADKTTARRVLDFVSGAVFLADAELQPIGNRAFLVLPSGIEVSSTERRRLTNLGYPGMTG